MVIIIRRRNLDPVSYFSVSKSFQERKVLQTPNLDGSQIAESGKHSSIGRQDHASNWCLVVDMGIVDELERVVLADFVDHASFALGMVPPVVVGVLSSKTVDVAWVEIERVFRLRRYMTEVRQMLCASFR